MRLAERKDSDVDDSIEQVRHVKRGCAYVDDAIADDIGDLALDTWSITSGCDLDVTRAERQWQLASDEDREKAPVRFVPRQQFFGT